MSTSSKNRESLSQEPNGVKKKEKGVTVGFARCLNETISDDMRSSIKKRYTYVERSDTVIDINRDDEREKVISDSQVAVEKVSSKLPGERSDDVMIISKESGQGLADSSDDDDGVLGPKISILTNIPLDMESSSSDEYELIEEEIEVEEEISVEEEEINEEDWTEEEEGEEYVEEEKGVRTGEDEGKEGAIEEREIEAGGGEKEDEEEEEEILEVDVVSETRTDDEEDEEEEEEILEVDVVSETRTDDEEDEGEEEEEILEVDVVSETRTDDEEDEGEDEEEILEVDVVSETRTDDEEEESAIEEEHDEYSEHEEDEKESSGEEEAEEGIKRTTEEIASESLIEREIIRPSQEGKLIEDTSVFRKSETTSVEKANVSEGFEPTGESIHKKKKLSFMKSTDGGKHSEGEKPIGENVETLLSQETSAKKDEEVDKTKADTTLIKRRKHKTITVKKMVKKRVPKPKERTEKDGVSQMDKSHEPDTQKQLAEKEPEKNVIQEASEMAGDHDQQEKERLITILKGKIAEVGYASRKNKYLMKTLTTFFKAKKMDYAYGEELHASELVNKYKRRLKLYEEMKEATKNEMERKEHQLAVLKLRLHEVSEEYNAELQACFNRELEIGKMLYDSHTGKPFDGQIVNQLVNRHVMTANKLSVMRLKLIKFQRHLSTQEARLKDLQTLDGNLNLLEFEQLKLDNQHYSDKIEDRESELTAFRGKVLAAIQTITHVREKSATVEEEIDICNTRLRLNQSKVQMMREKLGKLRKRRDYLREETLKMKRKSGILIRPRLVMDFADSKTKLEDRKTVLDGLIKTFHLHRNTIKKLRTQIEYTNF